MRQRWRICQRGPNGKGNGVVSRLLTGSNPAAGSKRGNEMKSADRERFKSLVEEQEFSALAALCGTVIELNEKLAKENHMLKEKKPNIFGRAYDKLAHSLERTWWLSVICFIFIAACTCLTLLVIYWAMPETVTNKYSIISCGDKHGIAVIQRVDWGDSIWHSGCLMNDNRNEVAREILVGLQEGAVNEVEDVDSRMGQPQSP